MPRIVGPVAGAAVEDAVGVAVAARPTAEAVRRPPVPARTLAALLPPHRMIPATEVRLDKWLWSVRLFKTRSLATEACAAGRVQVNGHLAKPARAVRPGDIVIAAVAGLTRTVKVLAPLKSRVGAKLVPQFLEDLTPAEELTKPRDTTSAAPGQRAQGSGRPTKRDRRVLNSFFGDEE